MASSAWDDTDAVYFGNEACANCKVEFANHVDKMKLVDKHVEFIGISRQVTNLEALRTIFKAEFQLNYHFAEGAEINTAVAMCGKCTQVLGDIHRLYVEFNNLASELSPLQELIRKTLTWIDKFRSLGHSTPGDTSTSSRRHQDFRQPSLDCVKREPVEDMKILPDLHGFDDDDDSDPMNSGGLDLDPLDSDEDWTWTGHSKRKDKDKSFTSKTKLITTEGSSTLTRSKALGLKDVTVSIEPLNLDKLVRKEPAQLGESESVATRRTYLINKQELRKAKRLLSKRKEKAKTKRLIRVKSKVCQICSKAFRDSYKLRAHMSIHTDERKFKCTQCSASYKQQKLLNRHMNVKHGVGEVLPNRTCEICGLYVALPSMLRIHMNNVHSTERPFCCEVCGKSFPTMNYLNIHKKMRHEGDRSVGCDQCGKVLSSKTSLQEHLDSVHTKEKDKKFACDKCPKRFHRQKFLDDHMETHQEQRERTLSCRYCENKFMTKSCLKQHERKHKMAHDQYVCADCGATFKNKSSLLRHTESRHTEGGGEFKCDLCGKVFKLKEYLMQHMRSKTHGGLGHYAERLKNGTTKRVVPTIIPLLEPGSEVVPSTVSTAKVPRRRGTRRNQSLIATPTSTTPAEQIQFQLTNEVPVKLHQQGQPQQLIVSEVQYIFAPLHPNA